MNWCFGFLLVGTRRDHRKFLNNRSPRRALLQLLPKCLGVLTPWLEVLSVGLKDQDGLGLVSCEAGSRRDQHRHGRADHNKPDHTSREAARHMLALWFGENVIIPAPRPSGKVRSTAPQSRRKRQRVTSALRRSLPVYPENGHHQGRSACLKVPLPANAAPSIEFVLDPLLFWQCI